MKLLRHRPIGVKLLLLAVVGLFMLALAALLAGSAQLTRDRMIADRVSKLRAVVDIAQNLATVLELDVVAGRLDRKQAIDRFRALVYAMRYNGEGYLFAYDLTGTVIALGNDPNVEGQNRLGLRDPKGRPLIQELLAAAQRGGGTVEPVPAQAGRAAPGEAGLGADVSALEHVHRHRRLHRRHRGGLQRLSGQFGHGAAWRTDRGGWRGRLDRPWCQRVDVRAPRRRGAVHPPRALLHADRPAEPGAAAGAARPGGPARRARSGGGRRPSPVRPRPFQGGQRYLRTPRRGRTSPPGRAPHA